MSVVKAFLTWLFDKPFIQPLFDYLGWQVFGCTPRSVKNYGINGVGIFWGTVLPIIVLVILAIILIKMFGVLNLGNLSGKYNPENLEKVPNSPLKGKNIVFLGSSVTKGFAAYGKSFVDMIAARTGANCVKEAVSGTTLVDDNAKSYVARLKALDPKTPCDLFVCQLSTNDATKKKPLGKVAAAGEAFDTKTVCGAIEYIIDYAKKTWNCPVAFYTNPEYASPEYKDMVEALYAIAKKWDVAVIDLWNDRELNTKEAKKHSCMNDQIHPTKKGYALWTPVMEAALENVIAGKAVPARPKTEPAVAKEQLKKKKTGRTVKKTILGIISFILAFIIFVASCGYMQASSILKLNNPSNSDQYLPEKQPVNENSPLKDKNLLFVGSSVVYGFGAKHVSFVDYLRTIDQANCIKETYSGSSITYQNESSYLPRLKKYDASSHFDVIIIQLSTNDAAQGLSLGDIGDSYDPADFDINSFTGGLESMLAYCRDTWGEDTPVMVFSNTSYKTRPDIVETYPPMVEKVKEIDAKWDNMVFLDMWDDAEINDITPEQYSVWMADGIHPMRRGYLEWWLPIFEKALSQLV